MKTKQGKQEEKPKKGIKDVEEEIAVKEGEIIKELEEKVGEYLNGWKRCQADFENYKKRQEEGKKEMGQYLKESILLELLPVVDNFHASTDHIPDGEKESPWVVGIMHIQRQLETVLTDNGVSEIPVAVGDEFDPHIHEAVDQSKKDADEDEEEPENEKESIKKIVRKGYRMGDRIIRPARVVVG
ncbi:MAG: nucleotide exchange factor GrpE [Candidatus Moranbacteria bacterium]|nr:nucleotide exchange factor GrpE [Candidatus Moranbacteria bacterium]